MSDLWFNQLQGNVEAFSEETLTGMSDSLKLGGWYRADVIADQLSVLAFNSLQFNGKSV